MSEKISELPAAGTLDGTEEVPLVQGGVTSKVTVNDLLPIQLQADKTVDLNGKIFTIQETGYPLPSFSIDPTEDNEQSSMAAINDTGDGNWGVWSGHTTAVYAESILYAAFNSVVQASIIAHADVSGTTNTHTADTHTFNGLPIMPDLIAKDYANDGDAAAGGIAVGGFYHSSGTLKIRLS